MKKHELLNEHLVDVLPFATTFILGVAASPVIKNTLIPKLKRAVERFTGKDYMWINKELDTTSNAHVIAAHKHQYEEIAKKVYNNKEIMSTIKRLQTGNGIELDKGYMEEIVKEFYDILSPDEQSYLLMIADPKAGEKVLHSVLKSGPDDHFRISVAEPYNAAIERKKQIEDERRQKYDLNSDGHFVLKKVSHIDRNEYIKTIINTIRLSNNNIVVSNSQLEKMLSSLTTLVLEQLSITESDRMAYAIECVLDKKFKRTTLPNKKSNQLNSFPGYHKYIHGDGFTDVVDEEISPFKYAALLGESLLSAEQYSEKNNIKPEVFDFFNEFDTTGKKKLINQMLIWYKAHPSIYDELNGSKLDDFKKIMDTYCMFDKSGRIKITDEETYALLRTNGFTIKRDPNVKPLPSDLNDYGDIKANSKRFNIDGTSKGILGAYGILPQIENYKTLGVFLKAISPLVKIKTNAQLERQVKDKIKVLANNTRYMIVMPTTDDEFCQNYGQNTTWCVADRIGKHRRAYMYNHNIKIYYIISKIYKNPNDRFSKMCVAVYPPGAGYENAYASMPDLKISNVMVHWYDSKNNVGLPLKPNYPLPDEMINDFIEKHGMTDADLKILKWIPFEYKFTIDQAIKLCADGTVGDQSNTTLGVVTIGTDGIYNVKGGIDLSSIKEPFRSQIRSSGKLPVKFGKVTGDFFAVDLGLKTLENSPTEVGGAFIVSNNKLKTLNGGPTKVGGQYNVLDNPELRDTTAAPDKNKLVTDSMNLQEVVTKLTIKPNRNNILYKKGTMSITASENENNTELKKNTNWRILPNELYFVIEDSAKFPSDAYHKLLYYPSARIKKLYNAASQEIKFDDPKVAETFRKIGSPWNNPTYIQNVEY